MKNYPCKSLKKVAVNWTFLDSLIDLNWNKMKMEKPYLQSGFILLPSKNFPAKISFSKIQKKNFGISQQNQHSLIPIQLKTVGRTWWTYTKTTSCEAPMLEILGIRANREKWLMIGIIWTCIESTESPNKVWRRLFHPRFSKNQEKSRWKNEFQTHPAKS